MTWMMLKGADKYQVSRYLGMSLEMIEKVYSHNHPDFLDSERSAMEEK
jgi:hypothetical protein